MSDLVFDAPPLPRCKHCGRDKGSHRANTLNCPIGRGNFPDFHQTNTYLPRKTRAKKAPAGAGDDGSPRDLRGPSRDWVDCPVCGESDMRKETDAEGHALIFCVNTNCASNGGTNAYRLCETLTKEARCGA